MANSRDQTVHHIEEEKRRKELSRGQNLQRPLLRSDSTELFDVEGFDPFDGTSLTPPRNVRHTTSAQPWDVRHTTSAQPWNVKPTTYAPPQNQTESHYPSPGFSCFSSTSLYGAPVDSRRGPRNTNETGSFYPPPHISPASSTSTPWDRASSGSSFCQQTTGSYVDDYLSYSPGPYDAPDQRQSHSRVPSPSAPPFHALYHRPGGDTGATSSSLHSESWTRTHLRPDATATVRNRDGVSSSSGHSNAPQTHDPYTRNGRDVIDTPTTTPADGSNGSSGNEKGTDSCINPSLAFEAVRTFCTDLIHSEATAYKIARGVLIATAVIGLAVGITAATCGVGTAALVIGAGIAAHKTAIGVGLGAAVIAGLYTFGLFKWHKDASDDSTNSFVPYMGHPW